MSLKSTREIKRLDPVGDFRRFAIGSLRAQAQMSKSDIAQKVISFLDAGDYKSLVEMKLDPSVYPDPAAFKFDYQLVSYLKKADFLHTGIDREANAVDKWCNAERLCARTNDNLTSLISTGADPELLAVLQKTRDFIKRALGPAPKWCQLDYRFGPGATALVKRGITLSKKYGKTVCMTPRLAPYVHDIVGVHWHPTTLLVVDGNELSFVPKTAMTHRAICVEPDLNIYCQLAIGTAIRQRMNRYFDLRKQADVNRVLVRSAQKLGLATIDLASASDCLSRMLVSLTIPEDWLELMDTCRSEFVTYKGRTLLTEKYSSMGNGFTFELETLIFYALARSVGADPRTLGVFGDDIVIEGALAPKMIEVLAKVGFETNNDKTFVSGRFFESCGVDVFDGYDVRPMFVRTVEDPSDFIKMVNDIQRIARLLCEPQWLDASYRALFERGCKLLRKHNLFFETPLLLGDSGVITSFDAATPQGDTNGNFIFKAMKFCASANDLGRRTNSYLAALDRNACEGISIESSHLISTNHGLRLRQPHKLTTTRGEGTWSAVDHTIPKWQWDHLGTWI